LWQRKLVWGWRALIIHQGIHHALQSSTIYNHYPIHLLDDIIIICFRRAS